MLSKVARFIFGDKIMKGAGEERKIAVIVIGDGIGQGLVAQGHQVLKVDIKRR